MNSEMTSVLTLKKYNANKEMEEWEAQVRNIENFNKVEYFMNQEDPDVKFIENGQVFDYQVQKPNGEEPPPGGSLLGDLPPLNPGAVSENKFSSHAAIPVEGNTDNHPPTAEGYNYSLVQMDDFLKDQGLFTKDSTNLVNNYYANLSMMAPQKP